MDFNTGNFIVGMALGPAAALICPFVVVPWLVALHLAVRKRNPLGIVDVCALVVCVAAWSLGEAVQNRMTERCLQELFFAGFAWSRGFVVRVLWSLQFEPSKLLLGILNGLLPLGWLLTPRVCFFAIIPTFT